MMRVVIVAIALYGAVADMRAQFRQLDSSASTGEDRSTAAAFGNDQLPLVVPLRRMRPLVIPGLPHVEETSFYVGVAKVGGPRPQELKVLFDTGSGHAILPHGVCKSLACEEHLKYSPRASWTSADVQRNGSLVQPGNRLARGKQRRDAVTIDFTQADLGDGKAQGVLVRDKVCLGGDTSAPVCAQVSVVAAINETDVPFRAMPHDGIIGLGLEGLVINHLASFFGRLVADTKLLLPQFGLSYGASTGDLFIGGHDASRLTAPLQWFPVMRPEQGYWQVAIHAVRVGEATIDACPGTCRGIVDSGASRLGAQTDRLPALRKALSRASTSEGGGCVGPDLEFDLGGMTLVLRAEDYTGSACTSQVGELKLDPSEWVGVYALGEMVLRRYYAAFDWEQKRVGFAPLASHVTHREVLGSGSTGTPLSDSSTEAVLV